MWWRIGIGAFLLFVLINSTKADGLARSLFILPVFSVGLYAIATLLEHLGIWSKDLVLEKSTFFGNIFFTAVIFGWCFFVWWFFEALGY